jgi:hypothetical protein
LCVNIIIYKGLLRTHDVWGLFLQRTLPVRPGLLQALVVSPLTVIKDEGGGVERGERNT